MRGFVLQDWVTIRGATAITQITQNESGWLSLEMYQDAIFWLQASEVTLGGATTINVNYQTAPIKDEPLFVNLGSGGPALTAAAQMPTPKITSIILSAIGSNTPLSRWVRWQLVPTASPAGIWDITFRILVSCNQLFTSGTAGGGYGGGGGGGWGQQMR
jgi:hypothetical protein